jgi:hypothetical protein
MSPNASGVTTCHVDARYRGIQENVEDGIIKIEFYKHVEYKRRVKKC